MQGLSSRAHAFSVEALVGKPCKRIKLQKACPTPRRGEDPSACDPQGQTDRSQTEDSDPSSEEKKPKESDCRPDREVRVELQGSELWRRFYEIGTEMIITKAGRRMFPSMRVKVRNLDPCQQYYIAMDVMPVDSKRYRYVYHSSQWMVAGNTDHSCISPRLYVHPDSPCAGETWMRQVISFDRVKLTNNEMDDKGHIILQSMHKYKPRVHIIKHNPRMDLSQIQSLPADGVHSFSFPETEFTTVTAYQNQQITKLKIDRNPFAKGFRDPGRNRGVLDGLLESYPWRGPFSLDFKPFTIQLQGKVLQLYLLLRFDFFTVLIQCLIFFLSCPLTGSSGSPTSSVKSLLPVSSSSSLHPLSCQDAAVHAFTLPLYSKTSTTSPSISPLPSRAFSSLGADRLRGFSPLPPLTDLPLFSALQGKKPPHCRDPCPHESPGSPCLLPLHCPLSPQSSPLPPHLSDTVSPYCLYRYSFPLNPQLAAISRHPKLAEDTTDCLLRQPPWLPTTNHCL
uniref:T-box transcription factor 22 n=1 Tax=Maylandia zebra TaxID=106582 RepID=A0A3P9BG18_9CICH